MDTRVENLKKIWNQKKNEIGFIQSEAAAKLNMTQGAISQYLNDFTVLNPTVIIKFANFLGVDPREIDPDILDHLPNVATAPIMYNWSNSKRKINQTTAISLNPSREAVKTIRLDEPLSYSGAGIEIKLPKGSLLWLSEEEPGPLYKDPSAVSLWIIARKNCSSFEVVSTEDLPPKSQLRLKYYLHGARLF